MKKSRLEKYLYELRRIPEHRTKETEKKIRKMYKKLLRELQATLADLYAKYAENDRLDYSILARLGLDARFLEEVEQHISGIAVNVSKEIKDLAEDTYTLCYDNMVKAVQEAAGDVEELKYTLSSIQPATPEIIRRAVQNPISGLTLKDTLEKHRKDIIYAIKRDIGVGLSNGDRYTTMARRISKNLDGDYKKSIRIVRTEAHRVREAGHHDAATEINKTLKNGNSGMRMVKIWRTMADERVRPNRRYKVKGGWKNGKPGKYNHVKMDGTTIPVDDVFKLPSGAKTKAPGQSGVAGEDINCRCFLEYDLVEKQPETVEKTGDSGTIKEKEYEGIPKKWKKLEGTDGSLKSVNPNYRKGEEYRNNCTNCVPAYELRKRGYDVIAKPSTKNHYLNRYPEAAWVNPEVIQTSGSGLKDILKAAESWQNGARAEITVIWKNKRKGHVFAAEKVNGKIEFYDVQSGEKFSQEIFDGVEENKTKFWRIDNLELSDRGITSCEAGGKNEI